MVNEPENQTFVVVDNSAASTAALLNAFITAYDVVYMEPGTYSYDSTTAISIPSGKKLIGLGTITSSNFTKIDFSGSPASRHILMSDSCLENVIVNLSGVAHTTNVIEGSSGAPSNYINHVTITGAASASIWGLYHSFAQISSVYIGGVDGIYLVGKPALNETPGPAIIENFYIFTAPTYGIRIGNVDDIIIRNGYINGNSGTTDYGIFHSETSTADQHTITDVTVFEPGIVGFYYAGTSGNEANKIIFDRCRCLGDTGVTDLGFNINYTDDLKILNCYADFCNGTASLGYGSFSIAQCDYIQIMNCESNAATNTNNAGLYMATTTNAIVDGFTSKGAEYQGIYTGNAEYSSISNVVVRSPTAYGLYLSGTSCTYNNFSVYDAGGTATTGIYIWSGNYVTGSNFTANNCALGIRINTSYSSYNNLVSYSSSGDGMFFSGTSCNYSGLVSYLNGSQGIEVQSDYVSLSNVQVRDNTSYGLYLNGCNYAAVSGVFSYSNSNVGIFIWGGDYSTYSSLSSYQDRASGIDAISMSNVVYSAFSAIQVYDAQRYGVYVGNCDQCTYSGVAISACDSVGFYLTGSANCSFSGVTAYGNASDGIFCTTNCDFNSWTSFSAVSNTDDGVDCNGNCDGNAWVGGTCMSNTSNEFELSAQAAGTRSLWNSTMRNGGYYSGGYWYFTGNQYV
jgi:hypothetical protein